MARLLTKCCLYLCYVYQKYTKWFTFHNYANANTLTDPRFRRIIVRLLALVEPIRGLNESRSDSTNTTVLDIARQAQNKYQKGRDQQPVSRSYTR